MPFDPMSKGYDIEMAEALGFQRDELGHMQSRNPQTGQMLKGLRHETFHKAIGADLELGFFPFINRKTGRIFTLQENPNPDVFYPLDPRPLLDPESARREIKLRP